MDADGDLIEEAPDWEAEYDAVEAAENLL